MVYFHSLPEVSPIVGVNFHNPPKVSPLRKVEVSPLRKVEVSPLRKVEVSPLRKVEVSEAVVPMSKNIIQCLKIEEGKPVKAESVFVRDPAVCPCDYKVQLLINPKNPDQYVTVHDLHPKLAYLFTKNKVDIPIRKVYLNGKKIANLPRGMAEWGYKKPEKYTPPPIREVRKSELDKHLIPDISDIVMSFLDVPTYTELRKEENGKVERVDGKDLKVGDIITVGRGDGYHKQDGRDAYRVTGFSNKRYIYVEELYYKTKNGEKTYNPKIEGHLGNSPRFLKRKSYMRVNYDGKFKTTPKCFFT
jgi:hypothetical protein